MGNLLQISHYRESLGVQKGKSKCSQSNASEAILDPICVLTHFVNVQVWKEHCFPSRWREAIVIPILKPGKVATDPLSYRPIALTSYFCKTFERMVNTHLVYVLEKEKCISPLQSGFRKGLSTLDDLVFLESQIRDAFVRRNHLVRFSLI
ncbi:putative RNA-directed DNA polymerase from transposon X-element [Trichonephila clavipes]|nr:putative RNA-directed DNA polymerase from transposon X-element [Trichonephila clavipes]